MWRSSSSRLTPAPTRTVADAASSTIAPGARRTTDPPPFCAGSPYARPRPRAMRPRSPASCRISRPSSSQDARSTTVAAVGAVRPQPVSSRWRLLMTIAASSVRPVGYRPSEPCQNLPDTQRQGNLERNVLHEPGQLGELPAGIRAHGHRSPRSDPCGRSSSIATDRHSDKREPTRSSRRMASVTPIDENESWISMVPPSVTRSPQSLMSALPVRTDGHRRCTARRSARRRRRARHRRTSGRGGHDRRPRRVRGWR